MAKDSVVDPEAHDKYLLQVTAGPNYDPSTHQEVAVNSEAPTQFESELITCWLKVRIKDYHGLPHNSPSTSPYFDHELHTSDRYSVSFSFVPKQNIPGSKLVLGFDYDHSIKHQLPPGFKYAMKIATTLLDPALYSDPYSDNPYLYGPALSGIFTLNIGSLADEVPADQQLSQLDQESQGIVQEGATGTGKPVRSSYNLPSAWKKRRKHFLKPEHLASFTFEKGRMYHADFFNPHLDFANFALRLPGVKISVARYIDEKTHHLRFVFKDREGGGTAFVVIFRLLFGEELERVVKGRKEETMEDGVGNGQDVCGDDGMQNGDRRGGANGKGEHAMEVKEEGGGNGTATVTSLANSIYAAFTAMGLKDKSSSEEDEGGKDTSPPPQANGSVNAQVDKLSDTTVEKYLQAQHSNV